VQLPWQLAWHFASHDADGGVPVHCALQRVPQLALHWAEHWPMQSAMLPLPMHWPVHVPEQLPSQSVSHDPWQLKLPGLAEHDPVQLPMQLPVHDADALPVQPPMQLASSCAEHATSKLTGVHCAVHPPFVSTEQLMLPADSTAPPHAERTSALALPANKTPTAASAAATSEDQRTMDDLPRTGLSMMRRAASTFPSTPQRAAHPPRQGDQCQTGANFTVA
jgi:hypothetical protein